jgi:hypothetical protein
MTDSQPVKLQRCGRCREIEFEKSFPEQTLCPNCRKFVIKKERTAAKHEQRKEISILQLELMWDRERRHEWDIQILDENGKTVWARDLAKTYRTELDNRLRRNWKRP